MFVLNQHYFNARGALPMKLMEYKVAELEWYWIFHSQRMPFDCILSLVTFLTFLSSRLINTLDALSCAVIQQLTVTEACHRTWLEILQVWLRWLVLHVFQVLAGLQSQAIKQWQWDRRAKITPKVTRNFYCPSVKMNLNRIWAEPTLEHSLSFSLVAGYFCPCTKLHFWVLGL